MATLTNEQIEQKKQLLAEKEQQMKALAQELKEAGAVELSDDDLDNVSGGVQAGLFTEGGSGEWGSRPTEIEKTEEEKNREKMIHAEGRSYL